MPPLPSTIYDTSEPGHPLAEKKFIPIATKPRIAGKKKNENAQPQISDNITKAGKPTTANSQAPSLTLRSIIDLHTENKHHTYNLRPLAKETDKSKPHHGIAEPTKHHNKNVYMPPVRNQNTALTGVTRSPQHQQSAPPSMNEYKSKAAHPHYKPNKLRSTAAPLHDATRGTGQNQLQRKKTKLR